MAIVKLPVGGGTASYIVSESSNLYRSREQVELAGGQGKLPAGMVLQRGVDGRYVPYAAGGTASAILFEDTDTTGGPVKVTISARDTEVQRAALAFAGTPDAAAKDAAYASLAALGFAFR